MRSMIRRNSYKQSMFFWVITSRLKAESRQANIVMNGEQSRYKYAQPCNAECCKTRSISNEKILGETTISLATTKIAMALASEAIKNTWPLIQDTSRSRSMSRSDPPPSPVAMAMIITPNRSNCLNPAFRTPEADETITASNVIQYRFSKRVGVGSNDIYGSSRLLLHLTVSRTRPLELFPFRTRLPDQKNNQMMRYSHIPVQTMWDAACTVVQSFS